MSIRRACVAAVAGAALTGCGGGASPAASAPAPSAPAQTPGGLPASGARYLGALDDYCTATVRAVERLARTSVDEDDPVRPIATLARRYRSGLETLATRTPPTALRTFHLLTLAQGRESADRIDDGVRLGRAGDIDAATTALGETAGLLPAQLPPTVRARAPACAAALG